MFNASDFWEPKPNSEVTINWNGEWVPALFLNKTDDGSYLVKFNFPYIGDKTISVKKIRSKHELF